MKKRERGPTNFSFFSGEKRGKGSDGRDHQKEKRGARGGRTMTPNLKREGVLRPLRGTHSQHEVEEKRLLRKGRRSLCIERKPDLWGGGMKNPYYLWGA